MARDALRRFGANIRRNRIKQGLSQEALAALSGLHRTYIGGAERGERNVSLVNLVRIARALDVTVIDLLHGVE
jgi:transcriptional regulator with XRE-family HTH domain